jgi:hypothetical protein
MSGGGDKNVLDNITNNNNTINIKNNIKTAAASDENQKSAAEAETSPEKIKQELLRIDKRLVYDGAFYSAAAVHLSKNNFDTGYLAWLYAYCKSKKPTSFLGLYFTLFFAENVTMLYRVEQNEKAASLKSRPPPQLVNCHVCGASYEKMKSHCPDCGIRGDATPEEINKERKIRALSPERSAEYYARLEKNRKEDFDLFARIAAIKDIDAEFGVI